MPQLLAHLFGDFILQSDWMAQNKTKRSWPCLVHALLYSLCFVPLCWQVVIYRYSWERFDSFYLERLHGQAHHFHWLALLVIFSTHFLIDRFRLARYVVWAKNWLGPKTFEFVKMPLTNSLMSKSLHGDGVYISSDMRSCWVKVNTGHPTHRTPPLEICPTGYPPDAPAWLSNWLVIIADNTLHLAINYLALRWL